MKNEDPDRDLLIPDETLASMRLPTSRDVAILAACSIEQAEKAAVELGIEPVRYLETYEQADLEVLVRKAAELDGGQR